MLADKDKLAALGDAVGVTGAQFAKAFQEDAEGAIISFLRALGELDATQQAVLLDELGLEGVRTSRAYIGLAESLDDNLIPALGYSNEAWEENNALQIEADKRFATTASQLKLLQNRIGDVLIGLGDALLPALNELVKWLSERVPAAMEYLIDTWNTTIGPAVGRMGDAFVDLFNTVVGIFTGGEEVKDWGEVVKGVFDGVAGAVAFIADSLGRVAGIFDRILGNEMMGELVKWAAIWAGVNFAFGGIRRAAGGIFGPLGGQLRGMNAGLAGLMPRGGLFGGRGAAMTDTGEVVSGHSASEALAARKTASNAQLKAAANLTAAADALMTAARMLMGGGIRPETMPRGPMPGGIMPPGALRGVAPMPAGWLPGAGRLGPAASAAAAARAMTASAAAAMAGGFPTVIGAPPFRQIGAQAATLGRQAVGATASGIMTGLRTAGRTAVGVGRAGMNVAGAARSLAGGAFSVAMKAFWPALVVMMVGDLAAQPIGSIVANTLGKANLGAEIQKDWIGGLTTWISSVINGVDVESISNLDTTEFQIGDMTIDTIQATKLGLARGTMETLFAEEATLEQAVLRIQVGKLIFAEQVIPNVDVPTFEVPPIEEGEEGFLGGFRPPWAAGPDPELAERMRDWRIQTSDQFRDARLSLQAAATEVGGNQYWRDLIDEFAEGDEDLLTTADLNAISARISTYGRDQLEDAAADLRERVSAVLVAEYGFKPEQVTGMSDAQIQATALMIERNIDGSLDAYFTTLLSGVDEGAGKWKPPKPTTPTEIIEQVGGAERLAARGAARPWESFGRGNRPAELQERIDMFDRVREDAEQFRYWLSDEGVADAQIWLDQWQDTIANAPADKQQGIIDDLVRDGALAYGSTWDDALALLNQKLSIGPAAIAADEASAWLDEYESQIIKAAGDKDLQAALEEELGIDWASIIDTREAFKYMTGETQITDLAHGVEQLLTEAADQGVDLTKVPWMHNALELLETAFEGGELTPRATRLLERILNDVSDGAFDQTKDDATERGTQRGRDLVNAMETGVNNESQALKEAIRKAAEPGAVPEDLAALMRTYGANLVSQLVAGIYQSQYDPALALAERVKHGAHSGVFADSPVRRGPLKDPFLPNIGKRMMREINRGFGEEGFSVPDFPEVPVSVAAGAVRNSRVRPNGAGQSVHIDRAYFRNTQDEQSLLTRTRFLMPQVN